jgi:hypothetical protein
MSKSKRASFSTIYSCAPLAMSLTMLLNILHVVIVERGEVGPSPALGAKELIKLGVKSLGIAMFGSVDEQRHQPRC